MNLRALLAPYTCLSLRPPQIGWTLHLQGRGWLGIDWYREIEAPVDSRWMLDAMIGDGGRSIAGVHLTRPRSARPLYGGRCSAL
jgi:hypothetical protein